ncbi:MAG: glycosyltransferase family 39 protein [Rhodoferax sp.]|nr:glycosyltransferase family 39 protein [Rhodoferax sp.]
MRPLSPLFAAPWNVRLLLAIGVLLHLALGAAMGLSVDEAHYALYALHPALSYFDHPPLVGWVQWPLVMLDAPTALLRGLPALLWLGTAMVARNIAMQLARGVDAQRAGLWAVVALFLAPLLHVLGIGLLPDTLLMFFGILLMRQTLQMTDAKTSPSLAQWLLLGVWLGLAGLSKYTAIFIALSVAACLLWTHGLRLSRMPGAWVALVIAMVMVLPVAIWNQQNHWISFTYQAQHGAGSAWRPGNVLQFLALQAVVFGPLLWWGWRAVKDAGAGRQLLLFFAIPFATLTVLSGGGSSLPHWTAPAWVALSPFAGIALARATQGRVRWGVRMVLALQALVCTILLSLMVSGGGALIAAFPKLAEGPNPFADLHGWDAAGARAKELVAQERLESVGVQNWTLASRLGWYARPLPVHVLEDRFDQFDFWAGDLSAGSDTLLVDWSQMAYALPLGAHGFASCQLLDTLSVTHWGYNLSTFHFYACRGWAGDPQPRLKGVGE